MINKPRSPQKPSQILWELEGRESLSSLSWGWTDISQVLPAAAAAAVWSWPAGENEEDTQRNQSGGARRVLIRSSFGALEATYLDL